MFSIFAEKIISIFALSTKQPHLNSNKLIQYQNVYIENYANIHRNLIYIC